MALQCMRFTACLYLLRRLLRFSSYGVKMYAFHSVSVSVKTAFAFSLVLRHSSCVSNACLHPLRRLLRFSSNGVTMYAFHKRVCIC